jgi:hypothetical protein
MGLSYNSGFPSLQFAQFAHFWSPAPPPSPPYSMARTPYHNNHVLVYIFIDVYSQPLNLNHQILNPKASMFRDPVLHPEKRERLDATLEGGAARAAGS